MAKRILADWLSSYIDYCKYSETPDIIHFWVGVSVLAGALQRRVWIDQIYFQWTPNFYIIVVAPPGIAGKTSALNIGMDLLRQQNNAIFGPDVITWQALVQSLSKARTDFEYDGMFHPMSCLTIASGELGNLLNPQDRELVDILTQLWDGQVSTFRKETKTQGSDKIVNPWMNIIACTTPSWWAGNVPEHMIGGGFTSRCIFVTADRKKSLSAYPKEKISSQDKLAQLRQNLLHDLEMVSTITGEYKLSPEALEWGTAWYHNIYEVEYPKAETDGFRAYLARKQTHLHKLAMVIASSNRQDSYITKEDLIRSSKILDTCEAGMKRVVSTTNAPDEVQHRTLICAIVQRRKKVPQGTLFRLVADAMSYKDFSDALISAQRAGLVEMRQQGNEIFIVYIEKGSESGK